MAVDMDFKSLIDFEYNLNHKVEGLISLDEAHEMFYEGFINKLFEPSHPKTIGTFEMVIYDLEKAKEFDQLDNMIEMIQELSNDFDSRYRNINKLLDDHDLDFKNKDRIIFLKNCIIHPKYRGKGILTELMKSIYLIHFTKNSLFLVNTSPIQNDKEEMDFQMNDYVIGVLDGKGGETSIMSGEYFNLNKLPEEDEGHSYKLYAKMLKLQLKQFEDTNFFYQDNNKDFCKIFNN